MKDEIFMYLFLATGAAGTKFPILFVAVYFIGFIAALVLGTIAWNVAKNPKVQKSSPQKSSSNSQGPENKTVVEVKE